MREILTYSTVALMVSVALVRPRVGRQWRIGPAWAATMGMLLLLASGVVSFADVASAASTLWRPLITILSIMITTSAAQRLGVLERLTSMIFRRADVSPRRLFLSVFVMSAATASLLNNDAAVLLLTPLVLGLIKNRYPQQQQLLLPFAFVVFMAAGVAPLVISNPMNMIVASHAGLSFNLYARWMVPISVVGWIVAFLILRRLFASELQTEPEAMVLEGSSLRLSRAQRTMLLLLLAVLGAYPIVASIDGAAIWVVSAGGALAAITLVWRQGQASPAEVVAGVAWEILVFLAAVFVLAIGLRNVGFVDYLTSVYTDAGIGLIGATAALGSAVLNNHPAAIINMLALDGTPNTGHREILAILIGGDLGPRLLPIGSLAGLLWLETCRKLGLEISLRQFVRIGFAVTVPTLIVSLLMLSLL